MSYKSRDIPLFLTLVMVLWMIVDYFLNIPPLSSAAGTARDYIAVVAAFAIGLGIISLLRLHLSRISEKGKDWFYSCWLVCAMAIMIVTGVFGGRENPVFSFVFSNIIAPSGSTMYALLAFFIASAAYRAFRARNLEAGLLLVCGVFVMLMNAPVGPATWSGIPAIGNWIMGTPNTAGMRGIIIGIALGAIGIGIRILLGLERTYIKGGG